MPASLFCLRGCFAFAWPTLGVFLALVCTSRAGPASSERASANLQVFDRVCALVREHYYDATFHGLDWAAVNAKYRPDAAAAADDATLYRTINTMLHLLHDDHTELLRPSRAQLVKAEKVVDVGIGLRSVEKRVVVTHVFQGSPADRAGVRTGWLFTRLNGAPLNQQPASFAPKPGTIAEFEFVDPHDQLVTRALRFENVRHQPQDYELATDDIVHVSYLWSEQFGRAENHWLIDATINAAAEPVTPAIVIDLRDNIGGDVSYVGWALGYFFRDRLTIGRLVSRAHKESEITTHRLPRLLAPYYSGPIVVLVGPNTSSAAEVFAAVMQRQHRALIVGQRTAGAVLGSELYSLPNGAALQISTADLVLSDGTRLEGKGVEPDIVTPVTTLAQMRAGTDPTIEAAMEALAQHKALPRR